jgi:hypothetical protein
VIDELRQLVALSSSGSLGRINALVRQTCGRVLTLPPLPAEITVEGPESDAEEAAVDFAEQFSTDVTGISDVQRRRLLSALGSAAFGAVVLTYIADFVPRVDAGLEALGLKQQPARSRSGITRAIRPTRCSTVSCPQSHGGQRSTR